MGCKSPRVGHCDARTPRSVRYVRTRPVLLPSPGVYGRIFCPHGWWLCGLFIWRCAPFSPGARRRLESCTPHVLSGQREQIPLCKRLSATQYPSGVGNRRRGICLFCRMPRLTAGPYPGWRCCRCRGPQTRRCNRPYERRAPRNCRWRRADSPCRAGPAPRPGSRRRRCPHNP